VHVIVSIECGVFFPDSSFRGKGGWIGEDTVFWFGFFCFLFFPEGVGECVNRVTELLTYDIYLSCDLLSSHTDILRSRALFVDHSLTLSDAADDFLTDLNSKCLC